MSNIALRPDPFADLLRRAGLDRSSVIRVTGHGGLPALIWLCRHGYDQVGYLKPGCGCPHDRADALIVGPPCDEDGLERLLADGPHVQAGGVLIFRSPLPQAAGGDPIHRLLAMHGYAVERCLHGARRELHVARRLGRPERKAA